jgi:hypothetical protein
MKRRGAAGGVCAVVVVSLRGIPPTVLHCAALCPHSKVFRPATPSWPASAQTAGRHKRRPSEILDDGCIWDALFVPPSRCLSGCLFLLHTTRMRSRVMPGAASQERALLRALSRSFCSVSSTSRPASARIRRFHSTSRNWALPTPPGLRTAASREPLLSRPGATSLFAAPSAPGQGPRPFSSTPASRHEHLDPPKPGEEYATRDLRPLLHARH